MSPLPLQHRPGVLAACALLLALLATRPAAAQNAAVEGLFISVENPITEDVARRIKQVTATAVERHRTAQQQRPDAKRIALKIVLDFTPNGASANSAAFGGCLELDEYLLSLQDVTTIAFVHGVVVHHSVLPVL